MKKQKNLVAPSLILLFLSLIPFAYELYIVLQIIQLRGGSAQGGEVLAYLFGAAVMLVAVIACGVISLIFDIISLCLASVACRHPRRKGAVLGVVGSSLVILAQVAIVLILFLF